MGSWTGLKVGVEGVVVDPGPGSSLLQNNAIGRQLVPISGRFAIPEAPNETVVGGRISVFVRDSHLYIGAAEAAEGRPRRHKEEEGESHRGHPRPYKLGAGVHLIFPLGTLFFF